MSELDGNAMAGDLFEVFGLDMTMARFTCAGCGHGDVLATLRLFGHGGALGQVARCPGCDDVVLRLVRAPDRAILDLRGTVRLEVPL